ncbi:cupin domain-containing protein [Rhizosphaericola mali]|uniref:Cupin domain-containing protein n=1 Tax=Rhizosphaericola mali TaxID=2545455 RepID=A0A5P2FZP7_9BACT|nr:cupin domain-containing protein [Rhizosphaericola mali]QES88437.1 cupin domain-containing protein [Rhizosphaericola mali]
MAELPKFKYKLEAEKPKLGPGGITRGASINEFPASVGLAGVSMHLDPGAVRELHWHANAAEWGYVVTGCIRTTIMHPDGSIYTDFFYPGDVWYFPKGYGHVLQGVGVESSHFILIFDNGNFSEDHTFSITDFVSSVPSAIAAQSLGLTEAQVKTLYQGEAYFAQCEIPTNANGLLTQREKQELITMHKYPLHAQTPRIFEGGFQRVVTQNDFPISTTICGSLIEIMPGGLRELHWHPNADEWQYFLEGTAEVGVFLAQGHFVKDEYEAGDLGYAPMGAGHYIKNTGNTVLKVLVGFNSGHYQSVDLSEWIAQNPKDIIQGNFGISDETYAALPKKAKRFIK